MFAIIKTGGKQYKVEEGKWMEIELLHSETGSKVEFNEVLFRIFEFFERQLLLFSILLLIISVLDSLLWSEFHVPGPWFLLHCSVS